jgi:hypothetical protein
MTKLINRYRVCPSSKNRRLLQKYLEKHPTALLFSTEKERFFLYGNNFLK